MKAILEFDFDSENDDKLRHEQAIRAADLCIIIFDFDNYLRDKLKNGELSKEADYEIEKARDELNRLIDEYEVRRIIEY